MRTYKIIITPPEGRRQLLKEDVDFYELTRMLDKCEIKSFKVELL